MQAVIYEEAGGRALYPLALLRPVFELRCGALLLREKLERRRPSWTVALAPRLSLDAVVRESMPGRGVESLGDGTTLLLSASVIVDETLLSSVDGIEDDCLLVADGLAVGAVVSSGGEDVARRLVEAGGNPRALGLAGATEVECRVARRAWDLVEATRREIERDIELLGVRGSRGGTVREGALLVEPGRIAMGEGSDVAPGVVLDASGGDILIGRDVRVMSNAYLQGPLCVGDGSLVRAAARIYAGTSIGPVCKVGGELSASVIHSYSNKQHDGFLGHSYVGSWVNLGAATDTSDLRNDYGPVRVSLGDETVDTGLTSVGSMIGDHTKTAIGTKLNTGSIVGAFCNVFPGAFPPKHIPSFSWGTPGGFVLYDIERALDTARTVMERRGVALTGAMEDAVRSLHSSM